MTNFPEIRTIDDVIEHFRDRKDFVIIDRGDYSVIDYVYADETTFENAHLREGRGLKFDRNGVLIGRPFQKFFNLNERPETRPEALDWNRPVLVMDKLDGSMIHPALINGELVFMTRKGITDVAQQAMEETSYDKDDMVQCLRNGVTPIYEYVSPNNRIVLRYEKPELKLLARRVMDTGQYLGAPFGRVVDRLDIHGFVDEVRQLQGKEGVVLRWNDGHMVKIKAEEYVRMHKAFDLFSSDKKVYEIIIHDNVDDVVPLLQETDANELIARRDAFNKAVDSHATYMKRYVDLSGDLTQREFALCVQKDIDPRLQPAYYQYRAGKASAWEAMRAVIARRLTTEGEIERHRNLLDV